MTTLADAISQFGELEIAKIGITDDDQHDKVDGDILAVVTVATSTPATSLDDVIAKAMLLKRYVGIYDVDGDSLSDIPEYPLAMSIVQDLLDLHEKKH